MANPNQRFSAERVFWNRSTGKEVRWNQFRVCSLPNFGSKFRHESLSKNWITPGGKKHPFNNQLKKLWNHRLERIWTSMKLSELNLPFARSSKKKLANLCLFSIVFSGWQLHRVDSMPLGDKLWFSFMSPLTPRIDDNSLIPCRALNLEELESLHHHKPCWQISKAQMVLGPPQPRMIFRSSKLKTEEVALLRRIKNLTILQAASVIHEEIVTILEKGSFPPHFLPLSASSYFHFTSQEQMTSPWESKVDGPCLRC